MKEPKVYIVPTPIGNLEDITLRALRILKEVDLIYAEDTRQAVKLTKHFEIRVPVKSHHQHNEHQVSERIVDQIKQDHLQVALISDAGTPLVSDPGYILIRTCVEKGVNIECLPGPTALIPALVESGLPMSSFLFEGFLPHQKGRSKRLKILENEERTMVFYESPYRVLKALKQFAEFFGNDRLASVSREISKLYAETKRGTLQELVDYFSEHAPKGEFVIVINGKKQK